MTIREFLRLPPLRSGCWLHSTSISLTFAGIRLAATPVSWCFVCGTSVGLIFAAVAPPVGFRPS